MAEVLVTLRIMPESADTGLEATAEGASELIKGFGGKIYKTEFKPVAFGLQAIEIMFLMDEAKGSTEGLEKQITALGNISSVEVIDVRRAVG